MVNKREIKVITHDGVFHADEVCAIALLKHFLHVGVNVVRARDRREHTTVRDAQGDKDVFVLDVGGKYDPMMLNFDHHQDKNMTASNILIFDWLINQGHINAGVAAELMPFLEGISDLDTNNRLAINRWRTFNAFNTYRNVSNIIAGFNTAEISNDSRQYLAFYDALNVMGKILDNEVRAAELRVREEVVLKNSTLINGRVLVLDEYCTIWKDKSKNAYPIAIMPHPRGWQVMSRDSDNYPLPDVEDEEGLVFLHENKFLALFEDSNSALKYANSQL